MPPGSHPGYSLLQNAHGARFEVGSAEGVIGWLPGDGDAGGQKLWLLPGGCKDSGLPRALWVLCSRYPNLGLSSTVPCAFPLIFDLQT